MDTTFFDTLDRLYRGPDTPASRDLRLNLKRLLGESSLDKEEALLLLAATTRATEHRPLEEIARQELSKLSVSDETILEAVQNGAIMAMLNTYYRFRHMIGESQDYVQTGLRMNSLARPAMGKERYELLSFAVSVLNGCETCIRSHEKVLRDAGVAAAKIHDAARLASVVRAHKILAE